MLKNIRQCRRVTIKFTIARTLVSQAHIGASAPTELFTNEWSKAKSFSAIPGPSKYELLKGFLPRGRFYDKSLIQINEQLRQQYGDIFLLPGTFGKRNLLFTFNPEDFQKVFRTEGLHPIRRGLDIVHYHRKIHRPEIFKHAAGLVAEQGESWAHFRSTVNPVMMNPKTAKLYAPQMNKVADKFIERIKQIRDDNTKEVPKNFEKDINNWAMDSVGLVALDTDLGMIHNSDDNPQAKAVIAGMREFFELLLQLDLQPSLWKYIATPKFKKIIQTLDRMTELTIYYTDQAIERLRANEGRSLASKSEAEKSVLERLLKIDRTVAVVMAMDIILAGVDTTSSALASCLLCLASNPQKQQKLRDEILEILPLKHTPITSDKLKNLPYLRACIKEAFRIYPVATGNFRSTGQNVVLSGYRVPRDVDVAMPGQLLMNDPKYYVRPEEYLPERWLRGEDSIDSKGCPLNRNVPFVFLPFGFGARICIGKRIVDLELEVVLAKLLRKFEITFDYSMENMFQTHIINVPGKPLRFKFKDLQM